MKLSELKLNPNNPQKFNDLSKLENSIRDFPKMMNLRPLVYDPATMEIIGGNKRLICLHNLKFKEIPDSWIKPADELTPEEKARREAEEDNTIVEGVSRHFPRGKNAGLRMWKAEIIINGKSLNLGYFHKKGSAINARKEAKQQYCPYLLTRM